ncbi:MAG: putative rRNA maturation factor [Verrucomicrobiota bacterium]|nr:putative rRNA maturation factor [Verrucomicrobiota bacterium]
MPRTIAITNRHPRLKIQRAAVSRAITVLDEHFEISLADLPHLCLPASRRKVLKSKIRGGCPPGELSLVFLTDPALAKIHADFMDDPTATDVITFEGDPAAGLAGEICVSADTAWRYVEGRSPDRPRSARGPTLQTNFSAELTLYLVHGWLHLAGYDDLQPARKRRMRAAEARAMKLLRKHNALPVFRLL